MAGEGRFDVCVVGGGVAGAYAAYRMLEARPRWRVGLFERSARVGGRLLSVSLPGVDGVRAELGGMRIRTSQPLVMRTVQELGLELRPFRTVHDDNRFFLRGHRWRAGRPAEAGEVYGLALEEEQLAPAELLVAAFERVVPEAAGLSDDEWIQVKRDFGWRGRPLRDWSLEDVLAQVLTPEGHRYVLDGFGYATILAGRNAADAIPWVLIEARPEAENHTLVDGMERLPRELAAQFEQRGGAVHLGCALRAVEVQDDESLSLRFADGPDVVADRVVLALPRRALEAVLAESPALGFPEMTQLTRTATAHAAAKLFMTYEDCWWRVGVTEALRAVTDLRLSKIYYFDRPFPDRDLSPPLLLASYSDGPARDYWRGLAREAGFGDRSAYDSPTRWQAYRASPEQVEQAQHQLRCAHPGVEVPEPVSAVFVDWGPDGAWHVWNPGVASWEVMSRITHPRPDVALYICGEAYSWSQGWVEGALETAQAVVDRIRA